MNKPESSLMIGFPLFFGLFQNKISKRNSQVNEEYQDVFTWSYADVLGLDLDIVEYALPLNPDIPSKKEKLRRTKTQGNIKG